MDVLVHAVLLNDHAASRRCPSQIDRRQSDGHYPRGTQRGFGDHFGNESLGSSLDVSVVLCWQLIPPAGTTSTDHPQTTKNASTRMGLALIGILRMLLAQLRLGFGGRVTLRDSIPVHNVEER